MTDELPKTGDSQAKEPNLTPGKGGNIPPVSRRFGQPGGNPRNVKGVPRDAIELRRLIKKIGAEKLKLPARNGEPPEEIRRLEALIKAMYSSRAPADRAAILKSGWPGILKDEIDLTSAGERIKGYVIISPDDWDKKDNGSNGDIPAAPVADSPVEG